LGNCLMVVRNELVGKVLDDGEKEQFSVRTERRGRREEREERYV